LYTPEARPSGGTVDTEDLKSFARKSVRVRISPRAPALFAIAAPFLHRAKPTADLGQFKSLASEDSRDLSCFDALWSHMMIR
jgi:hypothetical protein